MIQKAKNPKLVVSLHDYAVHVSVLEDSRGQILGQTAVIYCSPQLKENTCSSNIHLFLNT